MSISKVEKESALNLIPYFDKRHSVVFDVGSNKGDFAELFVDRVDEIYLFEPNELLIHYSMIRFCDRGNVIYCNDAISDCLGKAYFTYFINENNGLSNIIGNPKWAGLPWKNKVVNTSTLDSTNVGHIDLLKIDVEGAELKVVQGARRLLSEKRIKFIQIEKAEHIEVTGKTFQDVIDYLSNFGYAAIETNDAENVIFAMEGFTQDWNTEFKKNTLGMKFNFALEIGAFEGLTSCYICDNLLNDGGRMICVDPLTDEYLPGHKDNEMFIGQYGRFIRNTKGKPIELIRKKSVESFQEMEHYRFDFIYIDGDHREDAVFHDATNSFKILKVGGYMLLDDYEWSEETKRGIDKFLKSIPSNKMTVVLKGYQVMVEKHENLD